MAIDDEMREALDCVVLNGNGKSTTFKCALEGKVKPVSRGGSFSSCDEIQSSSERVLVVFIRHFFCGLCQEYIRRLVAAPEFETSALLEHNLRLVIVGCGAPTLIAPYRLMTGIPDEWQVFTDPSTKLYRSLGMLKTYSMGHHMPQYIHRSTLSSMAKSVSQVVKRLPNHDILAAGDMNVQGGEFLFQSNGASWTSTWQHRMAHSRDHTEINDLLKHVGLNSTASVQPPAGDFKARKHKRMQSSPIVLDQPKQSCKTMTRIESLRRNFSTRNKPMRPTTAITSPAA